MSKQVETQTGQAEVKPDMSQYVSRSDLAAAIADGIAAHEKARTEAEVQRQAQEAAAKAELEKQTEVQRAAIKEAVESAVAPLNEEIAKLKGATVVRGAPETAGSTNVVRHDGKEQKQDVFRGAFPGLGSSRQQTSKTTEAE